MNKILKDTLAITLITFVSGLALGVVHDITADPIARQQALAKERAYRAVFEEADSFGQIVLDEEHRKELDGILAENGYGAESIDEIMGALNADGEEIGYAFTVTSSEGYGGDIQFAMGVEDDGTVKGISILSISETAGLGMKADTEDFRDQFRDRKVQSFVYTKEGAAAENEIDAISGATITTNAVTNGVNAGLCALEYVKGGL